MSENWTNHLLQCGAVFENGSVARFGEREAHPAIDDDAICDLSHLGELRLQESRRVNPCNPQQT